MQAELTELEKLIVDTLLDQGAEHQLQIVPATFLGTDCNVICWLDQEQNPAKLSPMVVILSENLQGLVLPKNEDITLYKDE